MRRPSDYYRGANGILYATNDRLIFIGVAPGSKIESSDAPPLILSQEFEKRHAARPATDSPLLADGARRAR